jgi:hypothetical protein
LFKSESKSDRKLSSEKKSILPALKSKNYVLSDTSTCGVLNNARGDRGKLDIRDDRPS